MKRPILLAALALPPFLAALAAPPGAASPGAAPPNDVDDLVAAIEPLRDEAEVEQVRELAAIGTREAAQGLIQVYGVMGSLYMQREVLRALATFDGIPEAQEPALEKVANIATEGEDSELRGWAVDELAECRTLGKHFLQIIVASPADDMVRERAMVRHVEQAAEEDYAWYWTIYAPPAEDGGRKRKKDDDEEGAPPKPRRLPVLRDLAFRGLLPSLTDDQVLEAATDRRRRIRTMALEELGNRGSKEGIELAEEIFGRTDANQEVRAAAATMLYRAGAPKIVDQFLDLGAKGDAQTPRHVKDTMADLLAESDDPAVEKKLQRRIGKGKAYEKLFILRALAQSQDPKLLKPLQKLLLDKEVEVRVAAAQKLADLARVSDEKATEDTIEQLEKMLGKYDDQLTAVAGLQTLTVVRAGDSEWQAQLEAYLDGEDALTRVAAIKALSGLRDAGYEDAFVAKLDHPDWATRLAALVALEELRDPTAVGPIVAQLGAETGLMKTRFADALWRLTGQPHGRNERAWQNWWEREGDEFALVTKTELVRLQAEEEERRLRQVSRTNQFFGIKIESKRVIFIIDVSGSMNELTSGRYVGEEGDVRMEVAKRELLTAIDALEEGTLFNIITFSSDVSAWLDGDIATSDGVDRAEAREYVERLGALGGTNIYGAIQAAFEDPDVDSIYILSDGEPSVGDVIDPGTIRHHVGLWNANRGIVIHSIAVGGQLQVLEWLAEDSGGSHVKYP